MEVHHDAIGILEDNQFPQKKKFMSVRAQVSNANEFKLHSFAQSYIIHDHTVVMA